MAKIKDKSIQNDNEPITKTIDAGREISTHVTQNRELYPVDVVPSFAITLEEAKERVSSLQEFLKTMMTPGQDFGVLEHYSKPTLKKPGAEKLCNIFGFASFAKVVNRIEDWEKPFLHYEVKVTLFNKKTAQVEAEGLGSCNSKEAMYKNKNTFTIANTILKMAKKRGFIDAVLNATRSSGIFTQDIEDFIQEDSKPLNKQVSKDKLPATEQQMEEIFALSKEISMPIMKLKELLKESYQIKDFSYLSSKVANDLIGHLKSLKEESGEVNHGD